MDVPGAWERALSSIMRHIASQKADSEKLSVCAIGGKGLGKSTFMKMLAARVMNTADTESCRYALLETDLGQPLEGIPGVLSLRRLEVVDGNKKWEIEQQIFVGDHSPAVHPSTYIEAIKRLFERQQEEEQKRDALKSVLMVNIHGWNSGIGAEMIHTIMKQISPTHLVHLQHAERPEDVIYESSDFKRVYRLSPSPSAKLNQSGKEQRFLRIARYFQANSLMDLRLQRSQKLSLATVHLRFLLKEDELGFAQDAYMRLAADGALVGICRVFEASENFPEFLALAWVKAVELDEGTVHLCCPKRLDDLFALGMNALVIGSQETPLKRWKENDNLSLADANLQPFFAPLEDTVYLEPVRSTNRKNLKRRRLQLK